jgi:hypothetical protein
MSENVKFSQKEMKKKVEETTTGVDILFCNNIAVSNIILIIYHSNVIYVRLIYLLR